MRAGVGVAFMSNSTHKVEIVPVAMEPHPNADSLSVVRVFSGYTVCVRTADWQGRALGAYVPPDSLLDVSRPEFAFLADAAKDGVARIKVKRLRGVYSMGLLVPAPDGATVGDDVADTLGVTHYEPPQKGALGTPGGPSVDATTPPEGIHPVYDVESLRRYAECFTADEPVIVTEKIHGANGRWCYVGGEMHAGSRSEWKRFGATQWWAVLKEHPEIEAWCAAHPGWTLYGEVYGQVQDLKYGVKVGQRVAIFDVLNDAAEWLSYDDAQAALGDLLTLSVPLVYCGSFDLDAVLALAEGPSLVPGADHVREGIVVRPERERSDMIVGRVVLKVVGNGYLERA